MYNISMEFFGRIFLQNISTEYLCRIFLPNISINKCIIKNTSKLLNHNEHLRRIFGIVSI